MALTNKGFKRESYEDILTRMEAKAREHFGEDANTTARSPLGMLIRIMAWFFALVWQDIEHVFYSAYRKTAEGAQLDALMPYSGIERNPATHAGGPYQITGTPGTEIPMGFIVTKADDTVYYVLDDAVIGADGTVIAEIMADEPGIVGNAQIGEINMILNPTDGITSGTNLVAYTNGQEAESDVALRLRADTATEGLGSATVAAIRTQILQIPDVRAAFIDENLETVTNDLGTPPNNIQAFVLGGTNEEIANAIMEKRAGGIRPHGTTSVTVTDVSGRNKVMRFTRAQIVSVYVKVTLTTNNNFETDGNTQVKTAITEYVGGVGPDGAVYNGLNMGDDVILSKLLAQVYKVSGIEDVSILLSINGTSYNANNINIAIQQVARITEIEVM